MYSIVKKPLFFLLLAYTLFFCVVPISLYVFGGAYNYNIQLALISFLSSLAIVAGYCLSAYFGKIRNLRIVISPATYVKIVAFVFVVYVVYVFYSFGGIPLLSVFSGTVDPDIIRGEFFKGRTGFDKIVVYIGALLIYIFVPFSILISFEYKFRGRMLFFLFSLFYCILTLQKALLLNLLIPVFYYFFVTGVISRVKIVIFTLLLIVYFLVAINLSGHGDFEGTEFTLQNFFSAQYLPDGALDYFIWRSIAVPVYTSIDTLAVFDMWLNGNHLLGGTSSMLSAIFGVERVNLEKIVFEYQFGGFNFFANANAYFAVGLFADFGYLGLVVLSFLLGFGFGAVDKSKSIALSSMAFLLVYLLFNASLIGTLLSSGYLYLFIHAVFVNFKEK